MDTMEIALAETIVSANARRLARSWVVRGATLHKGSKLLVTTIEHEECQHKHSQHIHLLTPPCGCRAASSHCHCLLQLSP